MKNKPKTASKNKPHQLSEELAVALSKVDQAQNLNKALISSIGDGLIIVDEYGIITEVNHVALEMLGYEKKELIGQWLPRALPSKDKEGYDIPATERPLLNSLMTGHPSTAVTTYMRKDGSTFHSLNTAAPFVMNGKPTGAIVIFKDFSREMEVERAKDEFISIASHQLRTPLTSIMLYLELIKYEEANIAEDVKIYLSKIEKSANNMQQLIGDFLNISKLELGRLDVNAIPINLSELVQNILGDLAGHTDINGVKTNFEPPKYSAVITTDPGLLSQAIHNLLTNSVRYKGPKNPRIDISIIKEEDKYILGIGDNGIGIPESAKQKIFQRLFRADNAIDLQNEGTGLGLYLVKRIIETLGGEIWFESQENKGTTFFLKLPREPKTTLE